MKGNSLKLALVVVGLVALAACKPQGPEAKTGSAGLTAAAKNPGAVKLEFFVMSQCPFGVDVVNKVKEPVDKLGADLDFTMDFIGQTDPQGALTSMHGPNEVTGDIVQLCAMKYAPGKYLDMIVCQNKNSREVATNWEGCAKEAALPVDSIRTCMSGPEGKQLLTDSFKRSEARQARGSPTIFLNGKPYTGKRSPGAFTKEICNNYTAAKPAACANIPAPAAVNVTILSDKRCSKCAPERWVGMLKQRVENPVIKQVDYTEAEGKALYDSLGNTAANLPLVLFDQSLEADKDAAQMFGRNLQPMGSYRSLNVGGQWNPACAAVEGGCNPGENCNVAAATCECSATSCPKGFACNAKKRCVTCTGACDLAECKASLVCRKEIPKKLEVFVMSQCPYGTKALDAMQEVLKAFDNKLDFTVHYIGGGTAKDGLNSMHGPGEVDEDIRELCAMKLYKQNFKWMDYVACRNKDIRSADWQKCADKGIDAKAIEKCATTDGKKMLEDDFKVAAALGVGASPTWVANGKNEFSALDPESIRKNICDANKNEIKGCEKTLSGPPAGGPKPQGGCGQ